MESTPTSSRMRLFIVIVQDPSCGIVQNKFQKQLRIWYICTRVSNCRFAGDTKTTSNLFPFSNFLFPKLFPHPSPFFLNRNFIFLWWDGSLRVLVTCFNLPLDHWVNVWLHFWGLGFFKSKHAVLLHIFEISFQILHVLWCTFVSQ